MREKSLFTDERRGIFNLYDDWVFHYIFSKDAEENKQALIAIINVILGREEDPIESIQIMNPYIYGDKPYMKGAVLDIKAQTSRGELLDIEMQNGNLEYYANRSIFYCGKLVNLSLEKGEDYDKMKKSIVISIVKGNVLPQTEQLHSTFYFMESEEHFRLSEVAEIHFVELEKVDAGKPIEEMEPLERLAAYILFAGDQTQDLYVQELIEQGGEAVVMAERLFKELTEDQIAFEMREQQIKTEHSLATIRYVQEKIQAEIDQKAADVKQKEAEVKLKETEVKHKEAEVKQKQTGIEQKQADIEVKAAAVESRQRDLNNQQDALHAQEERLHVQKAALNVQQEQLNAQQEQLNAQKEQLHEQQRNIAIALKEAGTDDSQISRLTGLSLDEVSAL